MSSLQELFSKTLRIEMDAIEAAMDRVPKIEAIVSLIAGRAAAGKVIVLGMGKSGHIGSKIAATLASTGTPAFFVHPAEAGHGDLGMIAKNDTVLALSQSGNSEEILRIIPYIKRHKIPLIAFSGSIHSELVTAADFWIDTSVDKEACPLGLAPTASTTLALAMGDALAICLLSFRGFRDVDFADTHPLGTLGKRLLTTVNDVMADLDNVAVVNKAALICDSLYDISRSGLGLAVACDDGKPVGVFTDGDLRRVLSRDFDITTTQFGEVMSVKFVSVCQDQLAAEAVSIMESNKINALPVIDLDGNLVGLINMRQLLHAGVI